MPRTNDTALNNEKNTRGVMFYTLMDSFKRYLRVKMEGCLMEKVARRLVRDELMFRKKLVILGYARDCGNNVNVWCEFEVSKSSFYLWKNALE